MRTLCAYASGMWLCELNDTFILSIHASMIHNQVPILITTDVLPKHIQVIKLVCAIRYFSIIPHPPKNHLADRHAMPNNERGTNYIHDARDKPNDKHYARKCSPFYKRITHILPSSTHVLCPASKQFDDHVSVLWVHIFVRTFDVFVCVGLWYAWLGIFSAAMLCAA